MNKLMLLLLVGAWPLAYYGQQTYQDSLWNVWRDKDQPDTNRLKAMLKIAYNKLFVNADSALYCAQMQYDFAKSKNLKTHMADALIIQGASYTVQSDITSAFEQYQKSIEICEEIGYKYGFAKSLNGIGNIYAKQSNYPKALYFYEKGFEINEKIGDEKGTAISLNNIGLIYRLQHDYSNALKYFEKSVKISEQIGDNGGFANTLHGIGIIYRNQHNYDKALDCFVKSLAVYNLIGLKDRIAFLLNDFGILYKELGDIPKALEHFQNSIEIYKQTGNLTGIVIPMNSIGILYFEEGYLAKAIIECRKAHQLAHEIGSISAQKDACECLYQAYKALGDKSSALDYFEEIQILDDSLQTEETTKILQQMEFQKQVFADSVAKAEEALLIELAHEKEVRKQKQTRNWSLAGGGTALLLAGLFFTQRRRISKEKQRSEELLLNILPKKTAEELKEKGYSEAQLLENVTVLFTDFKGFTAMSEKLSPKDLVNDLNICFSEFDKIMGEHNIEKIKTIGDAYVAAGGLPTPSDTHASDVVKAAFEMRDFVEAGKAKKMEAGLPFFDIRIGIHTGPVVAGIVGVKKFQYDIWGDTVNTASRMESAGEIGKVNVSQATYQLLKDDPQFAFENRGKIEAKGKGEMEMWFVSVNNEK